MQYTLKTGESTVEGTPFNPLAESEYSYPAKRWEVERDLRTTLDELLKAKALYIELTNSAVEEDGEVVGYFASQSLMGKFDELFDA